MIMWSNRLHHKYSTRNEDTNLLNIICKTGRMDTEYMEAKAQSNNSMTTPGILDFFGRQRI